jgi:hypothetical protein
MTSLVSINGAEVSYSVSNTAEAKTAIKELKLLKKGYALQKKEVATEIQAIKFNYSQEVRSRGSMMRGGGGFGRFIRVFQTASRDTKRSGLASEIQPFEYRKAELDGIMHAIDQLVVKLEVYIHSQT